MQAAFVACDGYQCGYCTSGQIMSAVALLKEPCGPDDAADEVFSCEGLHRGSLGFGVLFTAWRVRLWGRDPDAASRFLAGLTRSSGLHAQRPGHSGRTPPAGIVVSLRPRTQHQRSLTAGIPVCLSETPPPGRPPCSCPRSLHDAPENALPWPWTDTAVRRMRLDQGPLHSPEDAE